MIYVVATIEVVPGERPAFLAVQKHLLPLVRAEKGCVEYAPSVEIATKFGSGPLRDNVVMMYEKWETLDDLNAHSVAPHMADFRTKAGHLIKNIKVEVFEGV